MPSLYFPFLYLVQFHTKAIWILMTINRMVGFPGSSAVKNPPAMWETRVQPLGQEDPMEKDMATYTSTFASEIPWAEEPGRLQSMGSQRVGHNLLTNQQKQQTELWLLKGFQKDNESFLHTYQRFSVTCCSVAKWCPTFWPHGLQHTRLLCPLYSGICSNSCALTRRCHPTSSSVSYTHLKCSTVPLKNRWNLEKKI